MSQDLITVDMHGAVPADAGVVDALAKLALALRRRDLTLRLENVPDELADLAFFMGLSDVLSV